MSKKIRLLICDDRKERRESWCASLAAIPALADRLEVVEFSDDKFEADIGELKHRRAQARPGSPEQELVRSLAELRQISADEPEGSSDNMFDVADVLVVDYALEQLERHDAYLTGALVAYLARCYSSCGVIVGVNQHGENPFDLTLAGDRSSFADVDIGEVQIANPGLWGASKPGNYRPWSWPNVPELVDLHRRRVEVVSNDVERPVLETLGLHDLVPVMPRSALQDLERMGSAVEAVTFEVVARDSTIGLRRGEHPMSFDALVRIAAARVAKWLDTAVVALQDVLIDAPHLASRNPLLLAGSPADPSSWDAACKLGVGHHEVGLIEPLGRSHKFCAAEWVTRPLWRWPDVSSDEQLPGVADPWMIPSAELVFAEDLSRFIPRDHARRFVMEAGTNTTRWVARPDVQSFEGVQEVEYQPQRRLAM